MKRITVSLSEKSIRQAIKECEKYQKFLKKQAPKFLKELAENGAKIARQNFDSATYDGKPDYDCRAEMRNDSCYAVVATGETVLFMEFGTGVTYPDDYPQKPNDPRLVGRGEFGQGKGKNRSWGFYYDGNGTVTGKSITGKNGKTVIITEGNPANACMYYTVTALQNTFAFHAQKIFDYK